MVGKEDMYVWVRFCVCVSSRGREEWVMGEGEEYIYTELDHKSKLELYDT